VFIAIQRASHEAADCLITVDIMTDCGAFMITRNGLELSGAGIARKG